MSKANYSTEVIIVGGGPAGISAAFVLGKAGIPTILVDKKPHNKIGDKVCGDALHPEISEMANEMCGLPIPSSTNEALKQKLDFIIIRGMREEAQLRLDDYSATVDRLQYGQVLLQAAEEFSSVTVLAEAPLRDVITENNFVKAIIVKYRGELVQIDGKVIIDASGSGGHVRKKLPLEMCTKFPQKLRTDELLVAYREIIRTKEPHQFDKGMYLIYEKELEQVMPGYYWCFSRGPKECNIGLGYFKRPENKGQDIRAMNAAIRDRYFTEYEIIDARGDSIPARLPLSSLVHNGFLTAGDAGALVNPINGEGHGPAIISGIKAAEFTIQALKKGDYSEQGLWEYNTWIWERYGALHALGIAIIKFIDKLGFEPFDWLLAKGIIDKDDILANIEETGPSLNGLFFKVLKLLRRPRVLINLKRALDLTDKIQKHAKSYPIYVDFEDWNNKLTKLVDAKI